MIFFLFFLLFFSLTFHYHKSRLVSLSVYLTIFPLMLIFPIQLQRIQYKVIPTITIIKYVFKKKMKPNKTQDHDDSAVFIFEEFAIINH